MPETASEGALGVVERLRKAVESLKVAYEGKEISVTISIGLEAIDGVRPISKKDLIKRADIALYKAKNTGRNRCCLFEL